MAGVAAAVANGGELMEPRLWSKVIDTDGREEKLDPQRQSRVMSEETAATLTEMMTDVVNEGTGGAAALADDQVASKTGTAEIDIARGINQAWFIGFAPPTIHRSLSRRPWSGRPASEVRSRLRSPSR
jgi:peptidoglycan glycosyltransferase